MIQLTKALSYSSFLGNGDLAYLQFLLNFSSKKKNAMNKYKSTSTLISGARGLDTLGRLHQYGGGQALETVALSFVGGIDVQGICEKREKSLETCMTMLQHTHKQTTMLSLGNT